MDRMIYTAMTGAKQLLDRQSVTANNLANANTAGFRAETHALRAVPQQGPGSATRAFSVEVTTGADFSPGPLQTTGRSYDVAIEGRGWIAVQLADGSEAYTRNGSLQFGENGLLQTRNGLNVAGESGPISIPADVQVSIASDGVISTVPNTNQLSQVSPVGRIKLVDPEEASLARGADGLFRLRTGGTAAADPKVKLASGALEGSNVNVTEALVQMIAVSRQFETQMKLLQTADANARQAAQLLARGG